MEKLDVSVLQRGIHAALRAWHTRDGTPQNLLESLQLVQDGRAALGKDANPALLRLVTSQILLEAIDELEKNNQEWARILRLRFPDGNTLLMVANKTNQSQYSVSRKQRTAMEYLAEILYTREMAFREQKVQSFEAHLPPASYSRLIGLKEAQDQLVDQLLKSQSPWTTAIVGIGGIGKTALADAVTRQVLREFTFEQVVWIRVDPQTMSGRSYSPQQAYDNLIADLADTLWPDSTGLTPAARNEQVRQALKSKPHLLIIDNLESEMDTAFVLAHLNDLADPSKFLLTSRTRPAQETAVFSYSLGEMSLEDATLLLRHQAQEIGVTGLEEGADAEIKEIYDVTGGNPLALKLVVSLLDVLPLSQVLSGMAHSQSGPIEDLYRHIYWKTWQTLSEDARSLLLAMPLVSKTGALPEQLQAITNLTEAEFWLVVQELRKRSLLDVRGTIKDRRYGIHRLTETFLHTEIIQDADEIQ